MIKGLRNGLGVILLGLLVFGNLHCATEPKQATPPPAKVTEPTTPKKATLADIVPVDTLVYFSLNDLAVNKEKFQETVLYKGYSYFLRKETLVKLVKLFRGFRGGWDSEEEIDQAKLDEMDIDKQLQKNIGVTTKELLELFNGELSFALTSFKMNLKNGQPEADFVLKVDLSNPEKAKAVLCRMIHKESLEALPCYQLNQPEAVIYKEKPNAEKGGCFTFYGHTFVAAFSKTQMETTLKALAGTPPSGSTLSRHIGYQKFSQQAHPDGAFLTFYLNIDGVLNLPMVKMLEMQFPVKEMLGNFGLDTVMALGLSMSIKDGRFYETSYIYAPGEKKELLGAIALPRLTDADGMVFKSESDIGIGASVMMPAIIAAVAVPNIISASTAARETAAMGSLKTLLAVEETWKQSDYDRNGIKDYWTYDIASMYRMKDAAGNPVKYCDLTMAQADINYQDAVNDANLKNLIDTTWTQAAATPKSGYYFCMIKTDETGAPYNQNLVPAAGGTAACNNFKWAACAYPAKYGSTGRQTFIISQDGNIWCKDRGTGGPVLQ